MEKKASYYEKRFTDRKRARLEEKKRIANENAKLIGETTMPAWKKERLNTLRMLLRKDRKTGENIMHTEAGTSNDEKLTVVKSLTTSSAKQPEIISGELSHTESLVDKSIHRLSNLIEDSNTEVTAACLCAHQLANLVRTKLALRHAKKEGF